MGNHAHVNSECGGPLFDISYSISVTALVDVVFGLTLTVISSISSWAIGILALLGGVTFAIA